MSGCQLSRDPHEEDGDDQVISIAFEVQRLHQRLAGLVVVEGTSVAGQYEVGACN